MKPERLAEIERLLNTPAQDGVSFANATMRVIRDVPALIAHIRELEAIRDAAEARRRAEIESEMASDRDDQGSVGYCMDRVTQATDRLYALLDAQKDGG